MVRKIVVDSAADLLQLPTMALEVVPLKINVGSTCFVDDARLDVAQLTACLQGHKGRSVTACPAPGEYLAAFGQAEEIICVTITSALSGSNNAAQVAAGEYMEAHPSRRVHVVDSLSTGPEMALLTEFLARRTQEGADFDSLCAEAEAYRARTRLVFSLESIRNLANNGRVSPAVAALVGLMGIRIVGRASDTGNFQQMAKCRGEKKALAAFSSAMQEMGWQGGRVRIHHCGNEGAAMALSDGLRAVHPAAEITLSSTRGLCSFYAEAGGLLIGFEGEV